MTLSFQELPALDGQGLEAILAQISENLLARGWMLATAEGAVAHAHAQASLAVTGVAGPSGGTPDKPVGLVWFGWRVGAQTFSECRHFDGGRAAVRAQTVQHALQRLHGLLAAA